MFFIAGTIIMSIALIVAPLLAFFYPYWKEQKGERVSERQLYLYRGGGIAIPLLAYVVLQLVGR
ncbi:hypothetical protein LF817_19210 [Halobacillus sp. A1]|uniref:hypothetical protein n=1 Tax=Halobacillus sp. A1 TaxID=2880262 RepID=UPI0020A6727C|nr:hypothetical protein [Halobacillus sp. A1]MCP3033458.1 hypothetical protein [Halobacillus sp. A1]